MTDFKKIEAYLRANNVAFEYRQNTLGEGLGLPPILHCDALALDAADAKRIPNLKTIVPRGLRLYHSKQQPFSLEIFDGLPERVDGNFSVRFWKNEYVHVTSLKGAPLYVRGNVEMPMEKLFSLIGGPVVVGGEYRCNGTHAEEKGNRLFTLHGAPLFVGKSFHAYETHLHALTGGPRYVGDSYNVSENQLSNLDGAPEIVPGAFQGHQNASDTTRGAPRLCGNFYINRNEKIRYDPLHPITVMDLLLTEHCPAYPGDGPLIAYGGSWRDETHSIQRPTAKLPMPEMKEAIENAKAEFASLPKISFDEACHVHMLARAAARVQLPLLALPISGFALLGSSMSHLPVMPVSVPNEPAIREKAGRVLLQWLASKGYGTPGIEPLPEAPSSGPHPKTLSYVDALKEIEAPEEPMRAAWRKRLTQEHPSAVAWALHGKDEPAESDRSR